MCYSLLLQGNEGTRQFIDKYWLDLISGGIFCKDLLIFPVEIIRNMRLWNCTNTHFQM